MSIQTTIPASNGVYTIDVGNMVGQVDIKLVSRSATTTGRIQIQAVTWAGSVVQLGGAAAIPMSALVLGPVVAGDFGHFQRLVITVTGVATPGGPIEVLVTNTNVAAPDGAYTGLRALTTQSYVETNTKLGTQFYMRVSASIVAGATYYLGFTTGALPVLVKSRECYALVEALSLTLYKGATFTGGTIVPVQNYNDIIPVASTVTIRDGVTPSNNGVQWGGSEHLYEAGSAGQRVGAGLPAGGERVLAPGKAYMVALQNTGTGTALVDYFLTWFEGAPDLPRS